MIEKMCKTQLKNVEKCAKHNLKMWKNVRSIVDKT